MVSIDQIGLLTNWEFGYFVTLYINGGESLYINGGEIEFGLMGLIPHSTKLKELVIYKFHPVFSSRSSGDISSRGQYITRYQVKNDNKKKYCLILVLKSADIPEYRPRFKILSAMKL